MPRGKKILGQPINEEKWAEAKARAAEEGHTEDYDYVMSIYKKMMHLSKSSIDNSQVSGYTKGRGYRLILAKGGLDEFRCGKCRSLLFKGLHLQKSFIEVKCRSCGTFNVNVDLR